MKLHLNKIKILCVITSTLIIASCNKDDDSTGLSSSDVASIIDDLENEGTSSGDVTGETATNSVPVSYNFSNDNDRSVYYYVDSYNFGTNGDTVIYFYLYSELVDNDSKESDMYLQVRYNINGDSLSGYSEYSYTYTFLNDGTIYSFSSDRSGSTGTDLETMNDIIDVSINRAKNSVSVTLNDVQTTAAGNIVNLSGKDASINFTYSFTVSALEGGLFPDGSGYNYRTMEQ